MIASYSILLLRILILQYMYMHLQQPTRSFWLKYLASMRAYELL